MVDSTGWTSIPVHADVRDEIRAKKPDTESYTAYLRYLVRNAESERREITDDRANNDSV